MATNKLTPAQALEKLGLRPGQKLNASQRAAFYKLVNGGTPEQKSVATGSRLRSKPSTEGTRKVPSAKGKLKAPGKNPSGTLPMKGPVIPPVARSGFKMNMSRKDNRKLLQFRSENRDALTKKPPLNQEQLRAWVQNEKNHIRAKDARGKVKLGDEAKRFVDTNTGTSKTPTPKRTLYKDIAGKPNARNLPTPTRPKQNVQGSTPPGGGSVRVAAKGGPLAKPTSLADNLNRGALKSPAAATKTPAKIMQSTGLLARTGRLLGGVLGAASNTSTLIEGSMMLQNQLESIGLTKPPKGSRSQKETQVEQAKRDAAAAKRDAAKAESRAIARTANSGRYIPGNQQVQFKGASTPPQLPPPAAPQRAAVEQRLDQYLPPQTVSRGSLRYTIPQAPASDAGMKNQDKNFKGSYGNTDDLKRMQAASLSRQQGRSNLTSEDLKPKDAPPPPSSGFRTTKAEAPKRENRKRLRATGRNEMLEENLRRALRAR